MKEYLKKFAILFIPALLYAAIGFYAGSYGFKAHYHYQGCDAARQHYVFESKHYGDFFDCYSEAYGGK